MPNACDSLLTPIVEMLNVAFEGKPSKQNSNVSSSHYDTVGITFIPCFWHICPINRER